MHFQTEATFEDKPLPEIKGRAPGKFVYLRKFLKDCPQKKSFFFAMPDPGRNDVQRVKQLIHNMKSTTAINNGRKYHVGVAFEDGKQGVRVWRLV